MHCLRNLKYVRQLQCLDTMNTSEQCRSSNLSKELAASISALYSDYMKAKLRAYDRTAPL